MHCAVCTSFSARFHSSFHEFLISSASSTQYDSSSVFVFVIQDITQYNTAHNRQISTIGIIEEVSRKRHRRCHSVLFADNEEIINPGTYVEYRNKAICVFVKLQFISIRTYWYV